MLGIVINAKFKSKDIAIVKNKQSKLFVANKISHVNKFAIKNLIVLNINANRSVIRGKYNKIYKIINLTIKSPCEDCKLNPDDVDSCPCGKISLLALVGGNFRENCTDPIPTCK